MIQWSLPFKGAWGARRELQRPSRHLALTLLLVVGCGAATPEELEAIASDCPEAPLLTLGGLPPFVGVNAYFLLEETTRALRRGERESAVLEEILGEASRLGLRVVRAHAFNDDVRKVGDSALQSSPGQYDPIALGALDLMLTRAHAHGIQLVLPLANHWDDYGGARQYVAWADLPEPVQGDPRFYTDARVRALYEAHVRALLGRVNPLDGIPYASHPAVLAWELLNEPRGTLIGDEGQALAGWVQDMGALVRSLAPGHLVGSGEEGHEEPGMSFSRNTAAPAMDMGSIHLYPDAWGMDALDAAAFGARWISERAETARRLGKPLLVGEFAIKESDELGPDERRAIYRGWLTCAERSGVAGAMPWLFTDDGRPQDWDPFSFRWRNGSEPSAPDNLFVDLLAEFAERWRTR